MVAANAVIPPTYLLYLQLKDYVGFLRFKRIKNLFAHSAIRWTK